MTTYIDEINNLNYVPNIVILLAGNYFSIRDPDSGLSTDYPGVVQRVAVNPTSIDPFRPTSTLSTSSFSLIDLGKQVSLLCNGNSKYLQGEEVRLWIGRSFVGMDFADYYELPPGIISKAQKAESLWSFSTVETKDRIKKSAFGVQSKLSGNILAGTTTITLQNIPIGMPTSGLVRINNEFVSYTGLNTGLNQLLSCIRGELGTIASAHDLGSTVFLCQEVTARNPVDLILQLLISSGGTGPYDVLLDGAGIDESLVDVAQIESVRDDYYPTEQFRFVLFNIESLKDFLEQELLFPLGLRLRSNNNGKIGLAVVNRNILELDPPTISDDNTVKQPGFSVDENLVANRIRILWDWSDSAQNYLRVSEFKDDDSINEFGERPITEVRFKGIRNALSGSAIVQSIALIYLSRFAQPRPTITVSTLMNASLLTVGDKPEVFSSYIPNDQGELDFISNLEVTKKSINYQTGDVQYQLNFTAYSGIRQCFIAPSDLATTIVNQKTVVIPTGRGAHYRTGWKMRLYDVSQSEYDGPQVNEIQSIVGDTITFVDNWTTTLTANNYKIVFADYDDVTDQQKKFCFISQMGNNFNDNKSTYQITIG
jgi:hypothetical protein